MSIQIGCYRSDGYEFKLPAPAARSPWAEIAQRRVRARLIVEALDVVEHVCLRVIARSICLPPDPLGLQRGEEALHGGVVPDVAGPAHRAGHAIVGHKPLELLARVWLP